jgi:hypothetical protein
VKGYPHGIAFATLYKKGNHFLSISKWYDKESYSEWIELKNIPERIKYRPYKKILSFRKHSSWTTCPNPDWKTVLHVGSSNSNQTLHNLRQDLFLS